MTRASFSNHREHSSLEHLSVLIHLYLYEETTLLQRSFSCPSSLRLDLLRLCYALRLGNLLVHTFSRFESQVPSVLLVRVEQKITSSDRVGFAGQRETSSVEGSGVDEGAL